MTPDEEKLFIKICYNHTILLGAQKALRDFIEKAKSDSYQEGVDAGDYANAMEQFQTDEHHQ